MVSRSHPPSCSLMAFLTSFAGHGRSESQLRLHICIWSSLQKSHNLVADENAGIHMPTALLELAALDVIRSYRLEELQSKACVHGYACRCPVTPIMVSWSLLLSPAPFYHVVCFHHRDSSHSKVVKFVPFSNKSLDAAPDGRKSTQFNVGKPPRNF